MAARLGRMLARIGNGTKWQPGHPSVLVIRLEGIDGLVARLGPDDADLVCQKVQERLVHELGGNDRLIAFDGNEAHLALNAPVERELLVRAGMLRRGCEAPVICNGRRVSLRATAVLAQSKGRLRDRDQRLVDAASAHLRGLPRSRQGALWTIDIGRGHEAGAGLLASLTARMRPIHTTRTPTLASPVPATSGATGDASAPASARYLAEALRAGGIELWFLPTFCCNSGATIGFEVRPRWRHPRLGLSGTAAFLTGLDRDERAELTRQVIRGAADALAGWTSKGHGRATVSLTLTAEELADPNLAELLLWEAERVDCAPARFEIACAEAALPPAVASAAMARAVAGNLTRLRDAGVPLALTEFGVGALAPDQVRRFGAGGVTLDRSLLRGIGSSEVQPMLVSLLALAKRDGLTVTADGVSSSESLALLARLGCDRARGPGLARTVSAQDCAAQLERTIPLWDVLPPVFHLSGARQTVRSARG